MKSNIIINQLLIGVTALLCSVQAEPQYYQNHEKGWHWYEIQEVEEKPEPAAEVLSTASDKKEETKRKSPKEIVASYRE